MTQYTEREEARRALLRAAKALVDRESTVLATSRAIAGTAHVLDPHMEDQLLLGFVGIASEGDRIVTPDVLHLWHPDLQAGCWALASRALCSSVAAQLWR